MAASANTTITINKINAAKNRMQKLVEKIEAESVLYEALQVQLQRELGGLLGEEIEIRPIQENRQSLLEATILRRIRELKNQGKSYDEIATRLNVESFKPAKGGKFNGTTCMLMNEAAAA